MTDAREPDDDVPDLTSDMEIEDDETGAPEPEGDTEDDDDLSFRIEVDEDEDDGMTDRPDDTEALRRARAAARTNARRAADLEREVAQYRQPVKEPPLPGDIPDIEAFDFDSERHAAAVRKWRDDSVARTRWEAEQESARERAQATEQRMIADYRTKAVALGVKDFDAAHAAVTQALTLETQSLIGTYARNNAEFVYALYKNPSVLARLARESDMARQAIMIGELQRGMKTMVKRKAPPAPEADTIQRGTAPVSRAGADKRMEKMMADAAKTGDYSKLVAARAAEKEKTRG